MYIYASDSSTVCVKKLTVTFSLKAKIISAIKYQGTVVKLYPRFLVQLLFYRLLLVFAKLCIIYRKLPTSFIWSLRIKYVERVLNYTLPPKFASVFSFLLLRRRIILWLRNLVFLLDGLVLKINSFLRFSQMVGNDFIVNVLNIWLKTQKFKSSEI